jgi:mono/diheme cytochrome c family protein
VSARANMAGLWSLALAGAALALPGVACKSRPTGVPVTFSGPMTLGGRTVSADRLRHGGEVYTQYCRPCHGTDGDGNGASAPGLRPSPRDLRRGVYKFGSVAAGQLPTDDDFVRIIKGGLHGTAMLAWDVPAAELDDLIQYTKAFSTRWLTEKAGEPILPAPDPWAADSTNAIERGKRVYHGLAQCAVACHPAYATKAEIYEATKELTHIELRAFRDDLYLPVAKDSDFGFKILPPDFTFTPLRSGETLADIYRSIAAGIGGTAMPTWKNVLPEADLWAMTHYIASLVALRETAAAEQLHEQLVDQPPWSPPALDGGTDGAATDGGAAATERP